METLKEVQKEVLAFRDEREWSKFHTPKNLAAAIAIEAAELQETMVWRSDREVKQFLKTLQGKTEISEEIADVLIATLLLCSATDVDPMGAISDKLKKNAAKYPSDRVRGRALQHRK
jgi:dCTP diphosphatase